MPGFTFTLASGASPIMASMESHQPASTDATPLLPVAQAHDKDKEEGTSYEQLLTQAFQETCLADAAAYSDFQWETEFLSPSISFISSSLDFPETDTVANEWAPIAWEPEDQLVHDSFNPLVIRYKMALQFAQDFIDRDVKNIRAGSSFIGIEQQISLLDLAKIPEAHSHAMVAYLDLLNEEDSQVVVAAVERLSQIAQGNQTVVAELINVLQRHEDDILFAVLKAFGELKTNNKEVVAYMLMYIHQDDAFLNIEIMKALTQVKANYPEVVDVLLTQVNACDEAVYLTAYETLGICGIGNKAALECLLAAAKDSSDLSINNYVIQGLSLLGKDKLRAIAAIMPKLTNPNEEIRAYATKALGIIANDRLPTLQAFVNLLQDPCSKVREAAAQGLGRFSEQKSAAMKALTPLLDSQAREDQLASAAALAKLDPAHQRAQSLLLSIARSAMEPPFLNKVADTLADVLRFHLQKQQGALLKFQQDSQFIRQSNFDSLLQTLTNTSDLLDCLASLKGAENVSSHLLVILEGNKNLIRLLNSSPFHADPPLKSKLSPILQRAEQDIHTITASLLKINNLSFILSTSSSEFRPDPFLPLLESPNPQVREFAFEVIQQLAQSNLEVIDYLIGRMQDPQCTTWPLIVALVHELTRIS